MSSGTFSSSSLPSGLSRSERRPGACRQPFNLGAQPGAPATRICRRHLQVGQGAGCADQKVVGDGSLTAVRASKLGNIFISNYFAQKYSDILVSTAVHPGLISTELGRNSLSTRITFRMLYSTSMGAQTQI
ncbi:hypothetical protein B0H17DRAFT_1045166 [Mycena rosella]|uniref:Uncharacterized protein n=1 Tax=Mycena rosella TaxID=1033263 RepID=A0AAD7DY30_MYCRO|nr:hypothetical protein B0H17DRAFT_1045166 [Mycena rosella]